MTERDGSLGAEDRPERFPPTVSVCIVNYNGAEWLERTLASVGTQTRPLHEILLIDSGSADTSLEVARGSGVEIEIVELGSNVGPARARNIGFERSTGTHVLFVDSDVELEPSCLAELLAGLGSEERIAAVVPRVLYAEDRKRIQYEGAESHFLGLMVLRCAGAEECEPDPRPIPITSASSACLLLDRRGWPDPEPFDSSFFIYLEDHDFALRWRARGHTLLVAPRARCFHGAGTEGLSLRRTGHYTSERIYRVIRNRWLLILKNYQTRTLLCLAPILALFEAFQFAGCLCKGWIRHWWRALRWLADHRAEIARTRTGARRHRRRGDRELLGGGPVPFAEQLCQTGAERIARRVMNLCAGLYWRWVQGALR